MTILSRSGFPGGFASAERRNGQEERGRSRQIPRGGKYSANEDGAMQPGSGGKWI